MPAPAQFYCDQDSNGGGWVLIGRGREGWVEKYNGTGNPDELATNPDGTDAFTPVQLPSDTINALLNQQPISDALPDGYRIRRALTQSGSDWQDLFLAQTSTQEWSWASLSAPSSWVSALALDHRWFGTVSTRLGSSNGAFRPLATDFYALRFAGQAAHNWVQGFGYGSAVLGRNTPSSYLWSAQNNGGFALPFTQVYLRPKLTQADLVFSDLPQEGLAESAQRQLPNSYTEPVLWRTSENSGSGSRSEMNTRVQAITQVGDTVFLGGDYAFVENAITGERVPQKFLSGYNVHTGELVRSFTPTFNRQVKSLEALPNGLLAVGGEFTKVNGQDATGLVLLDPATGEIVDEWKWTIENRLSGGSPVEVRTLDVQGDYLYVGGSFTHALSTGNRNPVYARHALRFKLTDGTVDENWRPALNGSVNGISASEDGKAVYLAGYFSHLLSHSVEANRLVALSATDASPLGNWVWESTYKEDTRKNAGFQFDVQEAGSTVFTAGSEHLIAQYERDTFARRSASVTASGGDFQDLHLSGDTVYGACHCGEWIYEGSGSDHKKPWLQSSAIHQIKLVGAFDRETGAYLKEFNPQLRGALGHGVWESFVDSTGVLWVGGDIVVSEGQFGAQKTVGFARFTPRDVVPPQAPTNLKVTEVDGFDELSWEGSAEEGVTYLIIRDSRVIATSSEPVYRTQHREGARYYVQAVDTSSNSSASTAAAQVKNNQ